MSAVLTFSPGELLLACILANPHLSIHETDADALTDAVKTGWLECRDDRLVLTPPGGLLAVSVTARRPVDVAARMAVLSCPLCARPGGFCPNGSCQVWPTP